MTTSEFKQKVSSEIKSLPYIEKIEIIESNGIVSGKVTLKINCFIRIFYNQKTIKISFSIILKGERIWAIDRDNRKGWHLHPFKNVKKHEPLNNPEIKEIIAEIKKVIRMIE